MTIRRLRIPGSLVLATFLGCSTGAALMVDNVVPRSAVAQEVDIGFFYSNLAPHGQWFFQADFGWVWHPARVNVGWRPYTEGRWVWADDYGWTWASQEPWGWATYHYGRWYFDPYYGWTWVPGRTWAPAWVSWRVDAGYIGWAPLWPIYFDLHPEYRWDRWHHDDDWDHRHSGRDWDRWVFTRDRDFTSDRVGRRAITDRRERDGIFSRSRDVTQYDENRPERIGHSIDRSVIEKATGRPVRSVRIEAADKPETRDDTRADNIRMFRPRVKDAPDKTPDRLGLAKEPSREARETDTIRQEKARLDKAPAKDKGRDRSAIEPAVREKDNERGGAGGADVGKPDVREPAPDGKDKADKPDRGQKDVAEPASEMKPAARPEAPTRGEEAAPKGKPEKAQQQPERTQKPQAQEQKPERTQKPQAQEQKPERTQKPQAEHQQPERTQKPQAQHQQQPERTQKPQAQHQQPERTQKPQAQHQQQPERTQKPQAQHQQQPERTQKPQAQHQPEQPQMQQQPHGQQGGAPPPPQGKPNAGKKQSQPGDPADEQPGQGKH